MGDYRDECLKRKAVQAGIVEQRPVSGKNGKARPSIVEFRINPEHPFANWGDGKNAWTKWKAYRSDAEAQRAMETMLRKNPRLHQFRLRDPAPTPCDCGGKGCPVCAPTEDGPGQDEASKEVKTNYERRNFKEGV